MIEIVKDVGLCIETGTPNDRIKCHLRTRRRHRRSIYANERLRQIVVLDFSTMGYSNGVTQEK